MFGCFTRNIYVSKICLHFLCAFWIIPWQFWEKKRSRVSQPLVRRVVSPFPGRKTSQYMILCSPKFLWSSGGSGFDVVVKMCEGGPSISDVYSSSYLFPCVHNAFSILLTSICTYKQCLQKNTFTGVDWLVHNYPYLEWHGQLIVISHINNVSDPSYYKVHWLECVEWFNNPFKLLSFSPGELNFMLHSWCCTGNIIPSLVDRGRVTEEF